VREQSPTLQVFEFEAFEFADEVLENVEVWKLIASLLNWIL
jgi:hypothetical protein